MKVIAQFREADGSMEMEAEKCTERGLQLNIL